VIGRRARAVLLVALACGVPDPDPLARVAGVSPQGSGVGVGTAAEIRFSAPVDADGLLDGRWLVVAEAAALRDALAAVESGAGAAGTGVAVHATIEDGGRRVVLRPRSALRGYTGYAIVLSSRARAADGRPVLDPDGRHRAFVASFETGAPDGPPPRPVLTEVRADAETPEAGGEYVEVANMGVGPLELAGFRLAKRTAGSGLTSCAIAAAPGTPPVPAGGVALVAGGAYDRRHALPAGVPVLACGTTALLGGIANDRAPEILLVDPVGAVVDTLGANGAPVCAGAVERIDPEGADEPDNLVCTDGSPGVLRLN
jgi:hypothetical protein